MHGIELWTPIEEGRFHLRSMQSGESIKQYLRRTEFGTDKRVQRRIEKRIKLAMAERNKALTAKAEGR